MTINQQPTGTSQAQCEGFTMDKHVHRASVQVCQQEPVDTDYRTFLCVATTHEEAREMRDEWLSARNA